MVDDKLLGGHGKLSLGVNELVRGSNSNYFIHLQNVIDRNTEFVIVR